MPTFAVTHRRRRGAAGRLPAALVTCAVLAACTGRAGSAPVTAPHSATPPPSRTAPVTAPPVSARGGTAITITAAGDLLAHEPVVEAARTRAGGYDFRPLLRLVAPFVRRADLAICHLETPLSPDDRHITYYPDFSSPRELAAAVRWTGFDTCTTASNHTLDDGLAGVRSTLGALDAAGVRHVGAARTATEQRAGSYDVRGVRVAHLDYTYGLNGRPLPRSAPWVVRLIDVPRILADARAARRAGAQLVIVGLHWGQEYQSAPTAEQRSIAHRLLASPDIDLILGCHAHVVQPIERIDGKYAVYGMGNLLAHHAPSTNTPPTRDGILVTATATRRGSRYAITGVSYTPVYVDQRTSVVEPVADLLRTGSLPAAERVALTASWQRTVARVTMLGTAARPDSLP